MCQRHQQIRRLCALAGILLACMLLQWFVQTITTRAEKLSAADWTSAALFLQTGVRVTSDDAEPPVSKTALSANASIAPVPQTKTLPAAITPSVQPLVFLTQEADSIEVSGACTYTYDKASLLLQPLAAAFSGQGPQVLIVHTHTTESYTSEPGQDYDALTHARTLDEQYNMIRVGQQVAAALESRGIGVIHDTTINDYPSYNGSYDRMKTIIETNLAKYPSIQMVLDLHRDAAVDEQGNPLPLTASFPDGEYAQLMLVVGTDEGGLPHPNWQQNLSTALKLQALLEREYPQLCRSLNLRQERFNQNQTPCSLLIEFGTDGNTLSQALRSADALADALAQLILSQKTA